MFLHNFFAQGCSPDDTGSCGRHGVESVYVCAGKLKEECTVIVVSHDLREIAPLVDVAWQMQPNGTLSAERDIRLLDNAVL